MASVGCAVLVLSFLLSHGQPVFKVGTSFCRYEIMPHMAQHRINGRLGLVSNYYIAGCVPSIELTYERATIKIAPSYDECLIA